MVGLTSCTWGKNGSRHGQSRSKQCVFVAASELLYLAWSLYEEDAGVVTCHAWGKCILTSVLGE